MNLMTLFGGKWKTPVPMHDNKTGERIAVFISIPKNASQSIIKILELGENRDEENTASLVIHENHQRARILNQRFDLNNLFVFCFSRNPYDRCVSWYRYHKNIEPYRSLSFDSWVMNGMPHHWIVQNLTDYVSEGITPLLQYNFLEQYKVDFVGKLENFSHDMKVIIERLNIMPLRGNWWHHQRQG
uniref:Sulfotransferase family protein n=1 Tax=Candidatus Kentrum sp. FW TaxID=2126338 RepID=A0A450SY24_9GAMM|nr:MAG: Sulfotransferase family protein [Candidatus Kentron sp. FW]VFJ58925.1 MAG: Sulfotransferase family protein [Candidatus Kentron sp. FW]VFJ63126.1 MAG: Sulfotransferase family protein [Candidatus Kentron sp. FW]